jgi:hypothetical protein
MKVINALVILQSRLVINAALCAQLSDFKDAHGQPPSSITMPASVADAAIRDDMPVGSLWSRPGECLRRFCGIPVLICDEEVIKLAS